MRSTSGTAPVGFGLALVLALCACGSDKKLPRCEGTECGDASLTGDSGPAADAGADSGLDLLTSGRVFDAEDAAGIGGIKLSTLGVSASSDKSGAFALSVPTKGKPALLELELEGDGYVPSARPVPEQGYLEVFLKKVDVRVSFRGDEGVSVRLPSGAGIDIPAGAVEDRQGTQIDGLVTLELAEIDGRVRTQAAALPGDGHARMQDKRAGLASLERALSIRILDDKESELTVKQAADVVALMPAPRADAPSQEHAYSYDEATGDWVEESTASHMTSAGVRAYRVDIEHLSWWAVGRFFEATTCIRACVEDASGKSIQGAQVWVVGASHAGVSSFFTGETGCGASDVVADANVVLVAQFLNAVSNPTKVATGAAVGSVRMDASVCTDAGTLMLKTQKANLCPQGFSACGNACVDLASDTRHCGTCGNACAVDQLCVIDACEGPSGEKRAVRGKVVDRFGDPWMGVTVEVQGVTQVTDATGAFAFDDVSVPYDLKVTRGDPQLYLGLTRADTEVRINILGGNSASMSGVVSGGAGFPLPTDHELHVTFVGPVSINFNAIKRESQNGSWSGSPKWSLYKPSIEGTVFAIQHNEATDVMTGIGSKLVTLTAGGSLTSPEMDIVLAPVTPHPVDFNLNLPAGMTFTSYDLGIGTYFRLLSSPPSTSFSLDVPDEVPDTVPVRLIVRAALGASSVQYVSYFGAATRTLNVDVAEPVAALAPADGAAATPQTMFEFTPQTGTVTQLQLNWVQGGEGLRAEIYSHDTTVALERLRAMGINPVPDDGMLTWGVVGDGPASTLDQLLDPARPSQATSEISSYGGARTLLIMP